MCGTSSPGDFLANYDQTVTRLVQNMSVITGGTMATNTASRPMCNTTANIDSDFDCTLGKTKVAPPTGKPSNPNVDPIPTRQAQLQIPSHAILQQHCEPEAMSETSSTGPSQLCSGGIPGPGTTHFLHGNPSVSMNTVTPNPNTRSRMVTQGYFIKFDCYKSMSPSMQSLNAQWLFRRPPGQSC